MKIKNKILLLKIRNRIVDKTIRRFRKCPFYPYFYRSYWHSKLYKNVNISNSNYFTAIPNPGAGIGHQLANWIAGYWYAKKFKLNFAHTPFFDKKWEDFLGFGNDEILVDELLKKGYKTVRLPLFEEHFDEQMELIQNIINSYSNKKIIFLAEQDQFYKDQFGIIDEIQHKFYQAEERKNNKLIYKKENFNIAIHVRRGDITIGQVNQNPNLLMRWQDNDYFKNVLTGVVENLNTCKPIFIYLFSQGNSEDFLEFSEFDNIKLCLDMNAFDSFLHMVYADLLITSKSSFSYKPSLLSNGIKICPKNFWHGYPQKSDWILAEENGSFDSKKLKNISQKDA